jgi:phosphotransferase system HPr (HPr) family protein
MDPSAANQSAGPLKRTVVITNPQGLHMRPLQAFVELASRFQSGVRVQRGGQDPVDGKSMLSLMLLGAEQGTQLTVEVEGPDGPAALDALVDLLANLESRVNVEE